jgi:NAD-dependent dihydropyrimidine dehydrogenase PreA subunit
MTPPDLPVLNETLCTGCGDCVAICPTDCLAMAGTFPWLARPAACVSCTLCVLVCPAHALEMAAPDEGDDAGAGT